MYPGVCEDVFAAVSDFKFAFLGARMFASVCDGLRLDERVFVIVSVSVSVCNRFKVWMCVCECVKWFLII